MKVLKPKNTIIIFSSIFIILLITSLLSNTIPNSIISTNGQILSKQEPPGQLDPLFDNLRKFSIINETKEQKQKQQELRSSSSLTPESQDNLGNDLFDNLRDLSITDEHKKQNQQEKPDIQSSLKQFYLSKFSEEINIGNYDQALKELDKGLFVFPKDVGLLGFKSKTLFMLKKYEEALETVNKQLFIDSSNLRNLEFKGNILSKLGEYDEAIKIYDKAISIISSKHRNSSISLIDYMFLFPKVLNGKGMAYYMLKDYTKAIDTFDTASFSNSSLYGFIQNNKGVALFALGYYHEAIKIYDEVLHKHPYSITVLNNKGNALSKLGKYDEAIKHYNTALCIPAPPPPKLKDLFFFNEFFFPLRDEEASLKEYIYKRGDFAFWKILGCITELNQKDSIKENEETYQNGNVKKESSYNDDGIVTYTSYNEHFSINKNFYFLHNVASNEPKYDEYIVSLINKGVVFYYEKKYEVAIYYFDEVLRISPNESVAKHYKDLINDVKNIENPSFNLDDNKDKQVCLDVISTLISTPMFKIFSVSSCK